MAQQTALDWLKDMLEWNYGDPQMLEITWQDFDDLLERAKQMEKEQIMKAVDRGYDEGCKFPGDITLKDAKQYYNDTYTQGSE